MASRSSEDDALTFCFLFVILQLCWSTGDYLRLCNGLVRIFRRVLVALLRLLDEIDGKNFMMHPCSVCCHDTETLRRQLEEARTTLGLIHETEDARKEVRKIKTEENVWDKACQCDPASIEIDSRRVNTPPFPRPGHRRLVACSIEADTAGVGPARQQAAATFADVLKQPATPKTAKESARNKPRIDKNNKSDVTYLYDDIPEFQTFPRVLFLHDSILSKTDLASLGKNFGFVSARSTLYHIDDYDNTFDHLSQPPDAVVVHVGVNDVKGKDGVECGKRLARMVRRVALRFPSSHVFVSQTAPVRNPTLDARREVLNATAREELAEMASVSFIKHAFPTDRRHIAVDGIHPTYRSAAFIARDIGHALEDHFWQKQRCPRSRPASSTSGQTSPHRRRSPPRYNRFPSYYGSRTLFPFPWDY